MVVRVLVSGFEPFGGQDRNPSLEAVRSLAGWSPQGASLSTVELPVRFDAGWATLSAAIAELDPHAVIALGEAGGRPDITVERIAVNLDDSTVADNTGERATERVIVPDAPAAYWSTLPVGRIVARLRAAGVPARASGSAGGHLCNHVLYRLLHLGATTRPGLVGGFVHLPYLPVQVLASGEASMSDALQRHGVRLAVEEAAAEVRGTLAAGGPGTRAAGRPLDRPAGGSDLS